jgi:hypothetical protein
MRRLDCRIDEYPESTCELLSVRMGVSCGSDGRREAYQYSCEIDSRCSPMLYKRKVRD